MLLLGQQESFPSASQELFSTHPLGCGKMSKCICKAFHTAASASWSRGPPREACPCIQSHRHSEDQWSSATAWADRGPCHGSCDARVRRYLKCLPMFQRNTWETRWLYKGEDPCRESPRAQWSKFGLAYFCIIFNLRKLWYFCNAQKYQKENNTYATACSYRILNCVQKQFYWNTATCISLQILWQLLYYTDKLG